MTWNGSPTRAFLSVTTLALALTLGSHGTAADPGAGEAETRYPAAERQDVSDDYFGTIVADPYRWLEQLDSPATRQWVTAQNELAVPHLAGQRRDEIIERLKTLWNYERTDIPFKQGGRYFFERNDGLQAQSVLYLLEGLDQEPRVLVDPNTFSDDGTVSASGYSASPDGRWLAYAVSDGGSDWDVWRVLEIATGELQPEELPWTKFTEASWAADSSGFYYSRYPLGPEGRGDGDASVSVFFHVPGTEQSEDREVFSLASEGRRNPYATASEDGRYVVFDVFEGYSANGLYVRNLQESNEPVIRLLDEWDARYYYLGNEGRTFYVRTTNAAPKGRVVAIDLDSPAPGNWREVLAEGEGTLKDSSYVGGRILAEYLVDARSVVKVYGTDGSLAHELQLPGLGTVGGFEGHADDSETFYSFESFLTPESIFRLDVDEGTSDLFSRPEVGFAADEYETRQVFYTSRDGTRVPMFVVQRKGLELDGRNRTLLYGYGGFNSSQTPSYKTSRVVWLEMGGVLAIANLRGGGEYGEQWHQAGTKLNKQNVFDDFIAAAEWLVEEGFTSTPFLAIQGGSNGGLLVGAVMAQRPELFGATLPAVGVMDMLRYHLPSANARQWSSDFGLSENEEEFRALLAYSPYQNLKPGTCYPPTLVTTADHDDRVVPWHSYKFGAALQHAQGCDHAVLVKVETRAGHGAGKPTWMRIEDVADHWAFLDRHLAAR